MARPREFDTGDVLEQAMTAFWDHGYQGASFAEIEARTGVKKASLFAAYGDKKALFLQALTLYLAWQQELLTESLTGFSSAKEGIEDWLAAVEALCSGAAGRRGCLAVKVMAEGAAEDPETAKLLLRYRRRKEAAFARAIQKGIAQRAFRRNLDVKSAAKYLASSIDGLRIAGMAGLRRADAEAMAVLILAALE